MPPISALLAIQLNRDQPALVVAQPFGLLDPVVEAAARRSQARRRECRQPGTAIANRQTVQPVQIPRMRPEIGAPMIPENAEARKNTDVMRPRCDLREPERQVIQHAGCESRFHGADDEAQRVELPLAIDEDHRRRRQPPGNHDAGDPAPRADAVEHHVARHFEQHVADDEQARAESRRRCC